ncbi:MAG: hypothetical protein LBS33_05970 [Streptococcaceae bacterium]|nr:hypothetical protein [Streptococcaceae bacterium]
MKKRLLLVTNDLARTAKIQQLLKLEGYEVMTSESCLNDIEDGGAAFYEAFDLIVLHQDLLNNLSESCLMKIKELRTSFLILSTISNSENLHCISYPVTNDKIISEISSHLKRSQDHIFFANQSRYNEQYAKHFVKVVNHKLIINGIPVVLSRKEFQLFELLTNEDYNLVDNITIFKEIWGGEYDLSKQPFLSNLVMKIRNKILLEVGLTESIILNKKVLATELMIFIQLKIKLNLGYLQQTS